MYVSEKCLLQTIMRCHGGRDITVVRAMLITRGMINYTMRCSPSCALTYHQKVMSWAWVLDCLYLNI